MTTADDWRRAADLAARGNHEVLHELLKAEKSELGSAYRRLSKAASALDKGRALARNMAAQVLLDQTYVRVKYAMSDLRALVIKDERSAD